MQPLTTTTNLQNALPGLGTALICLCVLVFEWQTLSVGLFLLTVVMLLAGLSSVGNVGIVRADQEQLVEQTLFTRKVVHWDAVTEVTVVEHFMVTEQDLLFICSYESIAITNPRYWFGGQRHELLHFVHKQIETYVAKHPLL